MESVARIARAPRNDMTVNIFESLKTFIVLLEPEVRLFHALDNLGDDRAVVLDQLARLQRGDADAGVEVHQPRIGPWNDERVIIGIFVSAGVRVTSRFFVASAISRFMRSACALK